MKIDMEIANILVNICTKKKKNMYANLIFVQKSMVNKASFFDYIATKCIE